MDELLEQFLIESRDLIAVAAADFAALARNPQSTGSIDSAFRAIHTLKGSVAVFAMVPAEQVLHAAEDVLERTRKGAIELDPETVAVLMACLDQIDRWVDDMERSGLLGSDAPAIADRVSRELSSTQSASPMDERASTLDDEWVARLIVREAEVLAQSAKPLIAFRYAPDADCFFRGDDPLAVVAAVPDLVALSIVPEAETWPRLDEIEPFSCFTVLEGLSTAPREVVSAAFRMMPDQVAYAALDGPSRRDEDRTPEPETRVSRVLRIDAARVEALGSALGELLVAINGVAPLAAQAESIAPGLASQIRSVQGNLERVTGDLQRTVSAVQAVPLEPTLRRLPRLVREIAQSLNKAVDFSMSGQDVEVDKQIADGLFEPLLHLLRNAIDHGIEPRDARALAGKPATGIVSLDIRRDCDTIVVRLTDDGAGMDPARIRRIALECGVLTPDAAETLSHGGILRLIFSAGFSTAETVSEMSGRGVGMNAVETAIEALRGTIDVESTPGRGSTFSLRLPANALMTRLLLVEAAGDRYGVSLDQVVETVGIGNDRLLPVGSGLACVLHGRTVPVLSLAALLGRSDRPQANAKLLLTRSGGEMVALRVDGFGERIDSLVRRPSGMLSSLPGVIGSTLLGDGGVLLVLDLPELAA